MKYIILAVLAILLYFLFYLSRRQRQAVWERREMILQRMRNRLQDKERKTND